MDALWRVVVKQADGKHLDPGLIAVQHRLGGRDASRVRSPRALWCRPHRSRGSRPHPGALRESCCAPAPLVRRDCRRRPARLDPELGGGPQVDEIAVAGEQEGVPGARPPSGTRRRSPAAAPGWIRRPARPRICARVASSRDSFGGSPNSIRCARPCAMRRWLSNGHGHLKCRPGSRSDAITRPNRSLRPTSPGPTVNRPLPIHKHKPRPAAADAETPRGDQNSRAPGDRSRSQTHSSGTRVRHMLRISSPVSSTAPAVLHNIRDEPSCGTERRTGVEPPRRGRAH